MKKALLLLLLLPIVAISQIPRTINYQGVLSDGSGETVADSTYDIVFRIFNVSSGSSALWQEPHSDVPTARGVFSVVLGLDSAITINMAQSLYLEMEVEGVTLSPRMVLTSNMRSFSAKTLELSIEAGNSAISAINTGNTQINYARLALTNSIANSDLTANAITTSKVMNGTVTTSKMADSAVSGLKLLTHAVQTAHLADGAVTDAKVANGISYSKLSGAPTSLPPSGAAGGDLTGTYPNPTVAANAITSAKIADGTITNADVSAAAAIAYSKLNLTGSLQGSDIAAGTMTSTNSHRALGNNDNVARELRFLEPSGSGVNYTAFKGQAQAGDITYTLPNTAPTAANQVLAVQSVAGNNATLNWQTKDGGAILFNRTGVIANSGNTSYNVQSSDDIIGVDMSAGTNFTVNLPPATTVGEIVIVKIERYNNGLLPVLTIQPNGTDDIDGANNLAFATANGVRGIYSDGAGNWYVFSK